PVEPGTRAFQNSLLTVNGLPLLFLTNTESTSTSCVPTAATFICLPPGYAKSLHLWEPAIGHQTAHVWGACSEQGMGNGGWASRPWTQKRGPRAISNSLIFPAGRRNAPVGLQTAASSFTWP